MPVTARLSQRFYERLGDNVANELVDWFNLVDATYRKDLKDLNELNFARFDATLGQRFAEADATLEQRFGDFETRLMRWMFTFWSTTLLALAGLALAVMRVR